MANLNNLLVFRSRHSRSREAPPARLQAGAWQRYVRVFDERTRYVADFFVSSFWHRHQRRAMSSGSPALTDPSRCLVQFYPVPTRLGSSHSIRCVSFIYTFGFRYVADRPRKKPPFSKYLYKTNRWNRIEISRNKRLILLHLNFLRFDNFYFFCNANTRQTWAISKEKQSI